MEEIPRERKKKHNKRASVCADTSCPAFKRNEGQQNKRPSSDQTQFSVATIPTNLVSVCTDTEPE